MTVTGSPPGPALAPPPAPAWESPGAPDRAAVDRLQSALRLPRPLCAVLAARGLGQEGRAKRFLRPLLQDLPDPTGLAGSADAVDRIIEAIRTGETVLVHGDYDVDGVSGAALLTRWIRRFGGRVVPFVPHRLRDGYDFGAAGLEAARSVGATLVVTVDSGTTAVQAVSRARSAGIDVIVTDHHTPGPELPPAVAVVNPNRADCPYPNKGLSGTGVVFKMCQLVGRGLGAPEGELWEHLDLLALATVADLVPLEGENRTLVRYGLRALAASAKPGLRALLAETGLERRKLQAGQVGFILAPRINAAGRMSDAGTALRLLLSDAPDEARGLAAMLEEENRLRQEEDRRTLDDALTRLGREFDPDRDFGVVLSADGWHPGVIGIVASRVVERIHRPTVLVAFEGEEGRGSARSIPGFDLYGAIHACRGHLIRYGGHRQAAGMSLRLEALPAFREAFNREARTRLEGAPLRPLLRPDVEIRLPEVSLELAHHLQYMGPFGIGNPRPTFASRGVELLSPPAVVAEEALRLRLGQDGARLTAVGFGLARRVSPDRLSRGPVDVVYQLEEREYREMCTVEARLLDVRPAAHPA